MSVIKEAQLLVTSTCKDGGWEVDERRIGHSKHGLALQTRQKMEVCTVVRAPMWSRHTHKGGELFAAIHQVNCTFCHCSLSGPDGTCTLIAT